MEQLASMSDAKGDAALLKPLTELSTRVTGEWRAGRLSADETWAAAVKHIRTLLPRLADNLILAIRHSNASASDDRVRYLLALFHSVLVDEFHTHSVFGAEPFAFQLRANTLLSAPATTAAATAAPAYDDVSGVVSFISRFLSLFAEPNSLRFPMAGGSEPGVVSFVATLIQSLAPDLNSSQTLFRHAFADCVELLTDLQYAAVHLRAVERSYAAGTVTSAGTSLAASPPEIVDLSHPPQPHTHPLQHSQYYNYTPSQSSAPRVAAAAAASNAAAAQSAPLHLWCLTRLSQHVACHSYSRTVTSAAGSTTAGSKGSARTAADACSFPCCKSAALNATPSVSVPVRTTVCVNADRRAHRELHTAQHVVLDISTLERCVAAQIGTAYLFARIVRVAPNAIADLLPAALPPLVAWLRAPAFALVQASMHALQTIVDQFGVPPSTIAAAQPLPSARSAVDSVAVTITATTASGASASSSDELLESILFLLRAHVRYHSERSTAAANGTLPTAPNAGSRVDRLHRSDQFETTLAAFIRSVFHRYLSGAAPLAMTTHPVASSPFPPLSPTAVPQDASRFPTATQSALLLLRASAYVDALLPLIAQTLSTACDTPLRLALIELSTALFVAFPQTRSALPQFWSGNTPTLLLADRDTNCRLAAVDMLWRCVVSQSREFGVAFRSWDSYHSATPPASTLLANSASNDSDSSNAGPVAGPGPIKRRRTTATAKAVAPPAASDGFTSGSPVEQHIFRSIWPVFHRILRELESTPGSISTLLSPLLAASPNPSDPTGGPVANILLRVRYWDSILRLYVPCGFAGSSQIAAATTANATAIDGSHLDSKHSSTTIRTAPAAGASASSARIAAHPSVLSFVVKLFVTECLPFVHRLASELAARQRSADDPGVEVLNSLIEISAGAIEQLLSVLTPPQLSRLASLWPEVVRMASLPWLNPATARSGASQPSASAKSAGSFAVTSLTNLYSIPVRCLCVRLMAVLPPHNSMPVAASAIAGSAPNVDFDAELMQYALFHDPSPVVQRYALSALPIFLARISPLKRSALTIAIIQRASSLVLHTSLALRKQIAVALPQLICVACNPNASRNQLTPYPLVPVHPAAILANAATEPTTGTAIATAATVIAPSPFPSPAGSPSASPSTKPMASSTVSSSTPLSYRQSHSAVFRIVRPVQPNPMPPPDDPSVAEWELQVDTERDEAEHRFASAPVRALPLIFCPVCDGDVPAASTDHSTSDHRSALKLAPSPTTSNAASGTVSFEPALIAPFLPLLSRKTQSASIRAAMCHALFRAVRHYPLRALAAGRHVPPASDGDTKMKDDAATAPGALTAAPTGIAQRLLLLLTDNEPAVRETAAYGVSYLIDSLPPAGVANDRFEPISPGGAATSNSTSLARTPSVSQVRDWRLNGGPVSVLFTGSSALPTSDDPHACDVCRFHSGLLGDSECPGFSRAFQSMPNCHFPTGMLVMGSVACMLNPQVTSITPASGGSGPASIPSFVAKRNLLATDHSSTHYHAFWILMDGLGSQDCPRSLICRQLNRLARTRRMSLSEIYHLHGQELTPHLLATIGEHGPELLSVVCTIVLDTDDRTFLRAQFPPHISKFIIEHANPYALPTLNQACEIAGWDLVSLLYENLHTILADILTDANVRKPTTPESWSAALPALAHMQRLVGSESILRLIGLCPGALLVLLVRRMGEERADMQLAARRALAMIALCADGQLTDSGDSKQPVAMVDDRVVITIDDESEQNATEDPNDDDNSSTVSANSKRKKKPKRKSPLRGRAAAAAAAAAASKPAAPAGTSAVRKSEVEAVSDFLHGHFLRVVGALDEDFTSCSNGVQQALALQRQSAAATAGTGTGAAAAGPDPITKRTAGTGAGAGGAKKGVSKKAAAASAAIVNDRDKKIRIMRALAALIELIGPKLKDFIGKVIATLRACMNDPDLHWWTVGIWDLVCRRLPLSTLGPILNQIVVSVLPYLDFSADCAQRALVLLEWLIVTNHAALSSHFKELPIIPDENNCLYRDAVTRDKTRDIFRHTRVSNEPADLLEGFERAMRHLNHDMSTIRSQAIAQIKHLIASRSDYEMYNLEGAFGAMLSRLVNLLLQRCSDPMREVKLILCECIGELGAIDPGHFQSLDSSHHQATKLFVPSPSQSPPTPSASAGGTAGATLTAGGTAKSPPVQSDVQSRSVHDLLPLIPKRAEDELKAPPASAASAPQSESPRGVASSADSTSSSDSKTTQSQLAADAAARDAKQRIEDDRFAILLINNFLVKAHAAAATSQLQDSAAYAMQELLRLIGCNTSTPKFFATYRAVREKSIDLFNDVLARMSARDRAALEPQLRGIESWHALSEKARDVCHSYLGTQYTIKSTQQPAAATAAAATTVTVAAVAPNQTPAKMDTDEKSVFIAPAPPSVRRSRQSIERAVLPAVNGNGHAAAAANGTGGGIKTFFKPNIAMRYWLCEWCRDMIFKATGSRALIFAACRGVVKSYTDTARALLPHLVCHTLQYGLPSHVAQIRAEIMLVLETLQPPPAASAPSAAATSSAAAAAATPNGHSHSGGATISVSSQLAAQSIFQLLDLLSNFASRSVCKCRECDYAIKVYRHKQLPALRPMPPPLATFQPPPPPPPAIAMQAAAVAAAATAAAGGTVLAADSQKSLSTSGSPPAGAGGAGATSGGLAWWMRPVEQRCLVRAQRDLIDSIPLRLLANAAYACKAYTRAVKYLEQHLREHKDDAQRAADELDRTNEARLKAAADAAIKKLATASAGANAAGAKQKKDRKSRSEADSDPAPAPYNGWTRLKFGSVALFERPGESFSAEEISFLQHIIVGIDEPDAMKGLASLRHHTASLTEITNDFESESRWADALTCYEQGIQLEPNRLEYRTGLLRCLRNLGHLRNAVDTARGTMITHPHWKPVLAAHGAQAAWRLGEWAVLREFLKEVYGTVPVPAPVATASASAVAVAAIPSPAPKPGTIPYGLAASPLAHNPTALAAAASLSGWSDTSFELGVGRLLLAIEDRDETAYTEHLARARSDIMIPLAAASWESYERAYPHFVQMHMIQEVEQIRTAYARLTQAAAATNSNASDRMSDAAPATAAAAGLWGLNLSDPTGERKELCMSSPLSYWDSRLKRTQMNFRVREPILSLRRILFTQFGNTSDRADSWLVLAREARLARQLETASGALMHAAVSGVAVPGFDSEVQIEQARLLFAKPSKPGTDSNKHQREALEFLDRIKKDHVRKFGEFGVGSAGSGGSGGSGSQHQSSHLSQKLTFTDKADAELYGRMCLLLAKWVQQTQSRDSSEVIALYNSALNTVPKWEKSFYQLAKYYDKVAPTRIANMYAAKGLQPLSVPAHMLASTDAADESRSSKKRKAADSAPAAGAGAAGAAGNGSGLGSQMNKNDEQALEVESKVWRPVMTNYASCLFHGHSYLFQALPRFLTIFFEFADRWQPRQPVAVSISEFHLPANERKATSDHGLALYYLARTVATHVNTYQFMTALPQVISRFGHTNDHAADVIRVIVERAFEKYPQQTLWMMGPASLLSEHERSGLSAADKARWKKYKTFLPQPPAGGANPQSAIVASLIKQGSRLFPQLTRLCGAIPGVGAHTGVHKRATQMSCEKHFPELWRLTPLKIIVPLQSSLTVTLPPTASVVNFAGSLKQRMSGTAAASASASASSSAAAPSRQQQQRHGRSGTASESDCDYTNFKFFADFLPTIFRFEDVIDVLRSKEKPKKLTMLGSDGVLYSFLAKREERGDMRKNSRMMDIAVVINRLLKKDPEGRKRKLHVRTYAVIPMNEECGLIEWVPNTTGFRHLVKALHDQLSIPNDFSVAKACKDRYDADIKMFESDEPQKALRELLLYREWRAAYPVVFHKWFLTAFSEPSVWFANRTLFTRSTAVWSMVGYIVGLGDRHGENILIDETNGECVHVDFDCLFNKGLTLEKPERVPFRLTPNMVSAFGLSGVEGMFRGSCEVTMSVMRDNTETLMNVLYSFVHDPLVEWKERDEKERDRAGHGNVPQQKFKIMKDIELRLKGASSAESLPLSPAGQVAQLIKEAASEENLSRMYIGWMPWL